VARDIAPRLDSFPDESEDQKNALAILRRVYKHTAGRGSPYVKSKRQGSASIEYTDVRSAFEGQPTRALRALGGPTTESGHSLGSFPTARPVSRMWPEVYE
jgi:hypothetical protein